MQDLLPWFEDYGINHICKMLIWFASGMIIKQYYLHIKIVQTKKSTVRYITALVVAFIMRLILLTVLGNEDNKMLGFVWKFFLCVCGIALTWTVSSLLSRFGSAYARKCLSYFGKESMSFYVLSYFIQTPGVTVYCKMGDLGIPYIIWVMGLVIGAIVFTIVASKFIKKNKKIQLLVLGV